MAEENAAEFWFDQAEAACNEIKDQNAADRAFARLHSACLQGGDITKAEAITARIRNPRERVKAHTAVARQYAKAGNLERCKIQLNRAKPLVEGSRLRDELLEACLQLAKSPALAISFITEQFDNPKAREELCAALARHGYLDDALKLAENQKEDKQQLFLRIAAATGAANAARIEDAERAVQSFPFSDAYPGVAQEGVWKALAIALYKQGDMESARKYAARVTDPYTIRTTRDLRRIKEGVPPKAPKVTKPQPDTRDPLETQKWQAVDPDQVKQSIEAAIANAGKNPIKATTGQFGPSNQALYLAKLRLGYAQVAALYRKAGDAGEAARADRIVEEAMQTLANGNAFALQLALSNVFAPQLALDDIEGLKRATAAVDPEIWMEWVDPIVAKVLSSGDVDGAKNIARRALTVEKDRPTSFVGHDRSGVISRFVEAGEIQPAYELVKTSNLAELTANACENAGRAMIKRDRGQLLRTPEWRNDLGAFQRACLFIGGALMAKQSGGADE